MLLGLLQKNAFKEDPEVHLISKAMRYCATDEEFLNLTNDMIFKF